MNLLIKNANIWNGISLGIKKCDLKIRDGVFVDSSEEWNRNNFKTLNADGRLCVPGFIEPHIHLDKALIGREVRSNQSGTLDEAIEIIWEKKQNYKIEEIANRAGQVIRSAVANGVTRIRSHVDVDNIGGLRPLKGVVEARTSFADIADVQIVAFPQEGIIQNQGTEKLMWEAMENGADVVGGMPFNEKNSGDSKKHISIAFDIAKAFDADIDMHIDETDSIDAKTLEMLAEQTIDNNWHGRVTAGHTCALAGYTEAYARNVISLVKQANINMITNPATNLMLQGRLDAQPKRRGITRVKDLLSAGVNVSFGQDCVDDTFYPFGRVDPLEVALITAHAAHMSLPNEIQQVFDMQTYSAARLMGSNDYGISPGCLGDLVILDASDPADAIRSHALRNTVIKRGKVILENEAFSKWHWTHR